MIFYGVHEISYCRVYFDAELEETYTSPGEWPWAALIFNDGVYIGMSGLYMT